MDADLFDANWYLRRYPDVAAAVEAGLTDPRTHFETFGIYEGRSPGPLFDAGYYLGANPDVAAAVAAGSITAYQHFLDYGAAEGRAPIDLLDIDYYLLHSPDVAAAVARGEMSAVEHFVLFGWHEGRPISPLFDADAYLRANPDVAEAVARGETTAVEHLLFFGLLEEREWGGDPEPIPPEPPVPDDGGGGGPVTVHHLYDGDDITAQPHDQRFVIHVDATKENVIKIDEYLAQQVVDLTPISGLQVYNDAKERQLEVRQAEYDGEKWVSGRSTPPYEGDSMGVWLHGHPHLQLTDAFGETVRFDVGAGANSFGYATVKVNAAPLGLGLIKPGAGYVVGGEQELLIGGDGTQVLWLGAGDMGVGGSGLDVGKSPDLFVAIESPGARPVIIGDYSYSQYDLIVPLFMMGSSSLMAPFDLTVRESANHLMPTQGLVSNDGVKTDLEVVYEGEREGQGKVFMHIANLDDPGAGAASESVAFLVDHGTFAVYNVSDGGTIDTTDDEWPGGEEGLGDPTSFFSAADGSGDDDVDPGCGCGLSIEYLIGGEGGQTITGGAADFAVLYGGAGNDTLESDAELAIYIGGEGDDTITLGDGGLGWIFFGGDAARNGFDTISEFGADADLEMAGDILDFSHFLSGITFREVLGGSDFDSLSFGSVTGDGSPFNRIVVKDFGKADLAAGDIDFGATAEKVVAINRLSVDGGETHATIWFADDSTDVTDVVKVAELRYTGTLSAENFSTYAEVIIDSI